MSIAERVTDKILNNHAVKIENRLCSSFRTTKSDCSRCVELCPVDAIQLSNEGVEITGGCINCGVCTSVCPNGVFGLEEMDDRRILQEIGAKCRGLTTFRISCEHGDTASELILPCLGRLTEVILLEPIRLDAERIEILQPSCRECPNVKASPHINRIIERTLYLYEMLGIRKESILVRSLELGDKRNAKLRTPNSELNALSRRRFLGEVKQRAMEIAVASIPDTEDKNGKKEEVFRDVIHSRAENLKRSLLIQTLKGFSSDELQGINKVDVPSEDAIVAGFEVNHRCTGCGVCVTLCPTGAIIQHMNGSDFYLGFRADLCTNCQVCVKTCMSEAIKAKEKVSLNNLLNQNEVRLFEVKRKTCVVCRMDFIVQDPDNGICPLCMERHRKQMAAIKNLFKEVNRT